MYCIKLWLIPTCMKTTVCKIILACKAADVAYIDQQIIYPGYYILYNHRYKTELFFKPISIQLWVNHMHVSIALHVFCWACTSKSQLMAINVQYKGMFSSFVWHERREVLKWEGTLCEFLGLYSYLKGILQNSDLYIHVLELEKGISLLLPSCYSLVTYTRSHKQLNSTSGVPTDKLDRASYTEAMHNWLELVPTDKLYVVWIMLYCGLGYMPLPTCLL